MNRFSVAIIALLSLAGMAVFSSCCKDSDETTTYLSFEGELYLDLPRYVMVGDTCEFRQSGLTKESGSDSIGWYWEIDDVDDTRDTTRLETDPPEVTGYWVFVMPDTLATFTATCGAFASGYYTTTESGYFTSLKNGLNTGSITEFDIFDTDSLMTDPRDGNTYLCHQVGDLVWTRTNMVYRKLGVPLKDLDCTSDIFGRFYSWSELPDVCPEGWRVPTEEDWLSLVSDGVDQTYEPYTTYKDAAGRLMVNARFNGNLLWEFWPKVPITNYTAFSAMPFGFATADPSGSHTYLGLDFYAAFWTSSTYEGRPVYRYIYEESNDVFISKIGEEDILLPVRCVRDAR